MPLTPEQIAEMDKITGFTSTSSPIVNARLAELQQLKANALAKKAEEEKKSLQERNLGQNAIGAFLDPIIKSGVRTGQAIATVGLKGINAVSGGALDKYTPEGNLDDALNRATNTPSKTPVTGTYIRPIKEETPKTVAGTAVGTVALGVGSPVAAGAALGLGSALEKEKDATGIAIETVATALGGKILEFGFKAVAPYLEKAAVKYGQPLLDKIVQYVPESAKNTFDAISNKVSKVMPDITKINILPSKVSKPLNQAVDAVENFKVKDLIPEKSFEKKVGATKKILNPGDKYTPTEYQGKLGSGEVKSTSEKGTVKGVFRKGVVETKTTKQHEELAEIYGESKGQISEKNLPSENIPVIREHARKFDNNIDETLRTPEFNVPFNQNAVDKQLAGLKASAKEKVRFVSGSEGQNAYNDIVDLAAREVAQHPYNTSGLRQAVKSFNKRMEEILGNEKLYNDASASAMSQAAKDVRDTFNTFIFQTVDKAKISNVMKVLKPTQAEPLIEKAAGFKKQEDFIKYVTENMDEFSSTGIASQSARKSQSKVNTDNQYVTSLKQDLAEIWNIANSKVESSIGSLLRDQLQREARLLDAADEISYKARGLKDKNIFQINHPTASKVGTNLLKYGAGGALGTGVTMELLR